MTTVLLVDDQELVRAGFRIILHSEDGIEVVGEATNGADAIRLTRELRPGVVCMDVQMPGMNGLDATRELIADASVDSAILILTTFDRDDYLFEALTAGASGFLLKTASPENLIEAVQVVARGDALLSPRVTRRVIERFGSIPPETPKPKRTPVAELTERESDVLTLVAQGMSNAEIASALFVGEATVKTHVSNLLAKLHVRDRIQAVVYAYENGFVVRGGAGAGSGAGSGASAPPRGGGE